MAPAACVCVRGGEVSMLTRATGFRTPDTASNFEKPPPGFTLPHLKSIKKRIAENLSRHQWRRVDSNSCADLDVNLNLSLRLPQLTWTCLKPGLHLPQPQLTSTYPNLPRFTATSASTYLAIPQLDSTSVSTYLNPNLNAPQLTSTLTSISAST